MRGDLLSLVLVTPLVFRAPPVVSGRAARCARGRRLPTFVACCAAGVAGAGWPGRPRGWAASLRSSPRLEARPCPPVPPVPSAPVGSSGLMLLGASARCPAGPTAAHGYRSLALSIAQDSHLVVTSHIPEPTPNFACNSPTTLSNHEFTTLELQCFQTLLKLYPIELCASLLGGGRMGACWWCSGIPQARCAVVWNRRRLCSWLLASG